MLKKNITILEEAFKTYYFNHFDLVYVPNRTSEREFGYQKFNSGMIRHILIKSDKDLHLLLMTNIPSDLYFSNAYYSFPNLPMAEKDWKEAILIFDIDSKDLALTCRKDHTCIICYSCGNISTPQHTCPKCNSNKLGSISVTCQKCIEAAKNEVKKLIEILESDLGINHQDIEIYFSGNEGFHIHVKQSQFQQLGSRERSDLVDYIMFRGAMAESFGMKRYKPEKSTFPELDENGWRGRVSKEIFGSKSTKPKIINKILSNGYIAFQEKLENLKNTIGIRIDPNVTIDVHRIFRLPGSINSKSGFSKILCKDIQKFNPFKDACFIDEEKIDVIANCPLKFSIKNQKFGPYNNEEINIPKYAAIYMICKGFANSL